MAMAQIVAKESANPIALILFAELSMTYLTCVYMAMTHNIVKQFVKSHISPSFQIKSWST